MSRAIVAVLLFAGSFAAGNATLEVVVTDELGKAVPGAIVHAIGSTRTLVTGADGRIVFESLAAGGYHLLVTKTLFAPAWFGRVGDGRGTTIALGPSERYRAAVMLRRSAAISGTVLAEDGSPMSGVTIRSYRNQELAPYAEFLYGFDSYFARTDSAGHYRLFDLAPGAYAVGAQGPDTGRGEFERDVNGRTQTVSYPAVFYPNASARDDARDIVVGAGDDIGGIDMRVVPVESSRIRVIVRASDDVIIPATATLMPRGVDAFADRRNLNSVDIKDGEATIRGVTAGLYTVFVSSRPLLGRTPGAPHGPEWGRVDVSSDGRSPVDIALMLEPMASVSGVVVFDGPAPSSFSPPVMGTPVPGSTTLFPNWIRADEVGRFVFPGFPPGSYSFGLKTDKEWMLASAMSGGRDVLDEPIVIKDRTPITDVVVTYTNKLTEVSGTLIDATGRPSFAAGVVVVADDPKYWTATCRRVRIAEPDSKGHFSIANLPPGKYRIGADAGLSPAECATHDRLEAIHRRGEVFTIAAGETVTRQVRVR